MSILGAQAIAFGAQIRDLCAIGIGVAHVGIVSTSRANRNSLYRAEPPDEVDFWQPSPHGFKAIPLGAPFFFRLGAPRKAIAGFGFFARYERVPVWLAWG